MQTMKFEIVEDRTCTGCYGIGSVMVDHKPRIAAVSETEGDGVIALIDPENFSVLEASREPGGGMNIVPLKSDGEFLCIQRFFPVFQSMGANVVWGYRENGQYRCKEVVQLPFVHRIEVLTYGGKDHLMCASLCATKDFTDDWSHPGAVYIGDLDYENRAVVNLHEIYGGVVQNHGLTKLGDGEQGVLISGQNGVHLLVPPERESGDWKVLPLIEGSISDCVAVDLDGDGELELGTISPFHGAFFQVWKKIDGTYRTVYTLPGEHDFGHAIWGGVLNGVPSFLVGYRAGEMGLYLIQQQDGVIDAVQVDSGAGPANVTVLHRETGDLICAANRQTDRYTIYRANV